MNLRTVLLVTGLTLLPLAVSQAASPYAGQQQRSIKALSSQDITGLLQGSGMGMAKAAELNHYPGPKHVLELLAPLQLSEAQRQATEAIFTAMRARAVELGKKIIELERRLDQLFADQEIEPQPLAALTQQIAVARGELRQVHLGAHLEQRQLLSAQQLHRYDQLRGYGSGQHQHHGH